MCDMCTQPEDAKEPLVRMERLTSESVVAPAVPALDVMLTSDESLYEASS